MSITICVQVFMRYVMQNSLFWSEELARYLFVLFVNVGISYGVKTKKHIRVEVFSMCLPAKAQVMIRIIADTIFLLFAIVIIYYGFKASAKIFSLHQTSPALGLQMGIVYITLPVSYVMVFIRLVQNIVETVRGLKIADKGAD
jgi:TRAP-type C4-dicarboxylate transport system permease small subunit